MLRALFHGLGVAALALGLAACGSIEVKPAEGGARGFAVHAHIPADLTAALARAPACCTSLAQLPYQNLAREGRVSLDIGVDAPAFTFDSGKSFFAAYRITDLPRPARLELTSYRSAGPGSLAHVFPDAQQLVFEPTVLVLDEHFQVQQRITAGTPGKGCETQWAEPVFTLPLTLTAPRSQAAYLVVMTSKEALQREGQTVCALVRHGMSPIGQLKLRVETLQFDDPPLQVLVPGHWFADAQEVADIGLLRHMTSEPVLLALGGSGLQVLEGNKGRYAPRLTLPYTQIVRVAPGQWGPRQRYLFVSALGASGEGDGAPRHFIFDAVDPLEPAGPNLEQAMALLAARIAPDRLRESVAWRVAAGAPVVEIGGPGASSRIGQAAASGGVLAAFPCGLCQMGGCTPEMLVSCAGLFTVGAVLGGLTGGLHESVAGPRGLSPATREALQSLIDAERKTGMAPARLAQCLAAALGAAASGPWRDQGRSATNSVPDTADAAAPEWNSRLQARGATHAAEVTLTRIALLPQEPAPAGDPAAAPLHLRIEAQVRMTDLATGRSRTAAADWTSDAYPPAEWTAADAGRVSSTLAQACGALAQHIVKAGEKAWARR